MCFRAPFLRPFFLVFPPLSPSGPVHSATTSPLCTSACIPLFRLPENSDLGTLLIWVLFSVLLSIRKSQSYSDPLFLAFLGKRKTTQKSKDLSLCQTPKIPGKEGKTLERQGNSLQQKKKARKSKKARTGRSG